MFIEELEFKNISNRLGVQWQEVVDKDLKPGKVYLISDRQFEYGGKGFNVVEKVGDKYRRVSIRKARKGSPYLCFDVASHVRERGQKQMLLHRARLIAFVGEDPDKPIARHGEAGSDIHDLENLAWGTHEENMDDTKFSGSQRGENNPSSKITDKLALSIYILSKLDLITPEIIERLPVGKGTVAAIKAKRKWSHVVSGDIQHLVELCEKVNQENFNEKLEFEKRKMEKENIRALFELRKSLKGKLRDILSDV